jgi:peroxiredoxin (alkyl hydroperoxide reductase subunit C)
LTALQTSDKHGVAMPLNWKKGDKVIVLPPTNLEQMQERLDGDYEEKIDWYLVKKSL